jgi:succinate dehydrogenase / fumarate reductase, flavoprotein subunit
VLPTVHYNMGGIPTNYHGEVLTPTNGESRRVVPGLMAVGEAACVSVHGANRLGSNSLLDLVVFGRAAARHRAPKSSSPARAARRRRMRRGALARLDRLPPRQGRRHRAIRLEMQRTCRATRGVPHRRDAAGGHRKLIHEVWPRMPTSVTDRSLIWNTDLIETLELDNLLGRRWRPCIRRQPHRKPRRARARGFPEARRRTG